MTDQCRPVQIEIDGQPQTIRVRGGRPPTTAEVEAIRQITQAARELFAAYETVRQRTLAVLREHWLAEDGRCRCGRSRYNATLWSVHVAQALDNAGVLLPPDELMAAPT
jgi:hypothetical protein